MIWRVMRRFLLSVLVLFLVLTTWFIALSLAPGDYFSEARFTPTTSPETLTKLRAAYGLSQPLPIRYVKWLLSTAHGDLGQSIAYNQPVVRLLMPRCRNTLLLSGASLAISWTFALACGLWAGTSSGSLADRTFRIVASLLLALPEIILATLLVYLAARTRSFPVGGRDSGSVSSAPDVLRHMVLPVFVLCAASFPLLFRHVRVAVNECLNVPFIQTARAFGISPLRFLVFYLLPSAANPLLSLFGLSVASLLSGSLIVEVVFGWPGLGPMFLEALFAHDTFLLLASVEISSAFLLTGNLCADLLLLWNDPRMRAAKS